MTNLTLGETSVRQLDGLYSLNDLHTAAGGAPKDQPAKFTGLDQTKALIAELSSPDSESIHIRTVLGKGKHQGTYACRELVIAYAAWISAAFHLKVIRVFLAQQSPPAPRENPKALPGALSKELRQAINRKAHALTLEAFDRLRDTLTREAQAWAARGNSETDILLNLQHPAHTVGDLHLIHAADLWPITASVAGIQGLIDSAVDAIHTLEQQTGRPWYGRGVSHGRKGEAP